MRFNGLKCFLLSAAVFVMLYCTGFQLSQHKLLWIDECFTQHVSVDHPSYLDILTLNFPDGNRNPLFYILQKINSDIFSFHYPIRQAETSQDVTDVRSQIIIRNPSNIYMSLALAVIFFYFARFFSVFWAFYALAVALVTPMIWQYWVEARPYSLWFLLTTVQILLFCTTVHSPKIKVTKPIILVHLLLILTTPGSIIQITIIALLLFLKGGFKKRPLIATWLVPCGLFLLYYFLVPIYKFKTFYLYTCLFDAVMPERLYVYAVYIVAAWMVSQKRKEHASNAFFLAVFLLFLATGCAVLFMNLFTEKFQFGFFSRYLIYIVPADIMMFTFASIDLWRWTRNNFWVSINLSIFLGGLVVVRGLTTYRDLLASALYLHSPGKI